MRVGGRVMRNINDGLVGTMGHVSSTCPQTERHHARSYLVILKDTGLVYK